MKNSKTKKILTILLIIIIILLVMFGVYYCFFKKDDTGVKVIKEIKQYGYTLDDNETDLYNEYFDELLNILSEEDVDNEAYAKTISKLFIIDFYTLDNKLSKNDIGGVQFIREDIRDNFIDKARGTFYRYLEVKSDLRNQDLPVVSSIDNTEVEMTSFTYKDKTMDDEAYQVTINWTYENDFDYQRRAIITLVKDGNKLSIIEIK